MRHPSSGRPLLPEERKLVSLVANNPVLRAELETLHVLTQQCHKVVEKLASKRVKPHVKCDACVLLLEVCEFPGGVSAIQSTGATQELCVIIRSGHGSEKKSAAAVLARLAAEEECRPTIAEGGTIDTLVHMIRPENKSMDSPARASAALTLANICSDLVHTLHASASCFVTPKKLCPSNHALTGWLWPRFMRSGWPS